MGFFCLDCINRSDLFSFSRKNGTLFLSLGKKDPRQITWDKHIFMSITPVPKNRFTGNQSLGSQFRKGSLHNNPKAMDEQSGLLKSQRNSVTNKPGQFIYKGNRNLNPAIRNHNEHAITSISAKFNTATVHAMGDKTTLARKGEERAHISGSVSGLIKKRASLSATTPVKPSAPKLQF